MRIAVPILAILLLAGVPGQAREALPEGCTREGARNYVCSWSASLGLTGGTQWSTSIAGLPTSVAELRVTPSLPDFYTLAIRDQTAKRSLVSVADSQPYRGVHYLNLHPGHEIEIVLYVNYDGEPGPPRLLPITFEIQLLLESAEGSIMPSIPAGGPDDPHLRDARDDARADLDIVAGWFNDPWLDDGVFEVGLVVPGLSELTVERHARVRFEVGWSLLGDRYTLSFVHVPADSLLRGASTNNFGGWDAALMKNGALVLVTEPTADPANGTIRAPVAIRGVGDPAAGVLFHNLSAAVYYGPPTGLTTPGAFRAATISPPPEDTASEMLRPFALGGPEIWTQLRGLTPLTVAPAAAPWYRDPFSTDNLPDTLQVGGAVLAGLTALWGLFVVRRRREAMARLLDDVDAVLEVHAGDHEGALAALRRLRERHDALWRKGTITESQHAMLQARVEGATGRLVLRPGH